MDKLIEELMQIKREKKLSYEAVARELNVSFNTVWRWAQGRFKPLPIVREKIKEFVKKNR